MCLKGAVTSATMSYEVHAPADKPLKRIVLRDEIPGTVKYSVKPDENSGTVHHLGGQ